MLENNCAIVARFFEEVCNGRKLAVADELFAANHRYHDPSSPWVGSGPEGMKQLIGAYQNAFGDATWSVDETLVAGDRVITRWTGRGTHSGDLQGLAATRKTVDVPGVWIHRIEYGKIVESWNVWDTLGMLHQLGVVAALGQASKQTAS
jgi:steroid delta-isomerase-like uncharacterized protein